MGNVFILGDLIVDNGFAFANSVVKIAPGVTIFVQAPSTTATKFGLSLINSKLFACEGLWKGIVLDEDGANIETRNFSEIEDAEVAILASDKTSIELHITHTTFSRNRIGISLEASSNDLGPIFVPFTNNSFTCNTPLNGTVDEITQIGININNVPNALMDIPSNTDNLFENIVNGVVATGDETDVTIYDAEFLKIWNRGIDFSGRKLKIHDSRFEPIVKHGIYFHEALEMDAVNNEFYLKETIVDVVFRYMIEIQTPKPANTISIRSNYFYTEALLFNWNIYGIYYDADNVSELNASIYDNAFDLYNGSGPTFIGHVSHAISLSGNMAANSDVDIENNDINVNLWATVGNPPYFHRGKFY